MEQTTKGGSPHWPPPDLKWDKFRWISSIVLPAWAGFQSRLGAYGGQSSAEPSDGLVRLEVDSPNQNFPISSAQTSAYNYLLGNNVIIRDVILTAVFESYPQWQQEFGYDADEVEEYMPNVMSSEGFQNLMGVSVVHILTVEKEGISYIGFEFGCTWDDEHGLGALTHKDRVVSLGGADTAFLNWLGEQDGGTDEEAKAELQKLKLPPVQLEPPPHQLGLFDSE